MDLDMNHLKYQTSKIQNLEAELLDKVDKEQYTLCINKLGIS